MKYDHKTFISNLIKEFPELKDEISYDLTQNLLTLEMSVFTRYTQEQINTKNEKEYKKCIDFIHSVATNCDDEILNAIGVSYLEHLNFKNDKGWAHEKLSPLVKDLYDSVI